ncbi:DNA-methyltransferase [Thioalkalivibrio sp. HK1]|uniref:DNA-methyltransferase n=1 Tax=Thioalkalivibrio sp. HK1 TaxID=1469245 RepID=UPI0004717A69|nr:site-specific DNA-methyltransferase [Thioalkalivibrio sp. HK1]
MSADFSSGTIWIGDCLRIMRGFDERSVDLIYLDPPFNSNRIYRAAPGTMAQGAGFRDIWTADDFDADEYRALADRNLQASKVIDLANEVQGASMRSYLSFMAVRLWEMHRILKDGGSLYLHCDPGVSHYLKLILDALFQKRGFQNEIVWCYGLGGSSRKRYSKKHDAILFYTKGASSPSTFNKPFVPSTSHKMKGKPKGATDVWEIPALNNMSKERTGYPSQKPLALLERIVAASSDPGDMVLDPFCGCATTLVAADRLQRRWMGIDRSPMVADLVDRRIRCDRKEWSGVSVFTDPPHRDESRISGDDNDRNANRRCETLHQGQREDRGYRVGGDACFPLADIDTGIDSDSDTDTSPSSSLPPPPTPTFAGRRSPSQALDSTKVAGSALTDIDLSRR